MAIAAPIAEGTPHQDQ